MTNAQFMQQTQDREKLQKTENDLADVNKKLNVLLDHIDKTTSVARERIEEIATQLVKTSRHDFRKLTSRLEEFTVDFDRHLASALTPDMEEGRLSARTFYIRGIAAHYTNNPKDVKKYLSKVVGLNKTESGETNFDVSKRVANAYYYLGVNESNFKQYGAAINYFDEANKRDTDKKDFLSKVVTAEAYIMNEDFAAAENYISKNIEESISEQAKREGLRQYHVRLQSRTTLMKAGVIIKRFNDWPSKVQQMLKPVHEADPDYYYATYTLAQSALVLDKQEDAKKLFSKSYQSIEALGDLGTVNEVRSRILLLMVTAMCCQMCYPGLSKKSSSEYLEEARTLLDDLPKRDNEDCTVFSPLTKQNEPKSEIAMHIGLISAGKIKPVIR